MKKILSMFLFLFLIFLLPACTSVSPESMNSARMMLNLEKILVPGKTAHFEIEELLGKPNAKEENAYRISVLYLDGDFYLKNTEKNKEILKPYIPEYFLEDENRFEKSMLMIESKYDNASSDYLLRSIFFLK